MSCRSTVDRIMVQLGLLQEFREGEDWFDFVDRLNQYFVANKLDVATESDRRRPVLLTVCGTYSLMKDLLAPTKPSSKTYDELAKLIEDQYKPKAGVLILRYKFYTHVREAGQDLSSFFVGLRHLAEPCGFGATLDTMLRDFFVMGINKVSILKKLLAEDDALTLSKAVSIAQASVTTDQNRRLYH